MKYVLATGVGLFSTAALAQQPAPQHHHALRNDGDRVRNALSAAPKAVAADATVMTMDGETMRVIRQGKGEFTCFPDDPTSPGSDLETSQRFGPLVSSGVSQARAAIAAARQRR